MTEETNAAVAVFVADDTYVCGFGSDGGTALFSACSLVRWVRHRFVIPCLEVCFRALLHPARSAPMPSHDIVSMSTAFISLAHTSLYRR